MQLGEGVAYLSFPTLGWRFWESHPFPVAFNSSEISDVRPRSLPSNPVPESKEAAVTGTTAVVSPKEDMRTTTFFARVRSGITGKLAVRAVSGPAKIGIVVDGPYPHSGDVKTQLRQCSSVLCIAGGVGITALLPYLRQLTVPTELVWATRKSGLAAAFEPAMTALPTNVEVDTTIGQRMDLDGVLKKALVGGHDGPLGIVVCGPAGMSDHVRHRVVQLTRNGGATRPYVLVDEAFGW